MSTTNDPVMPEIAKQLPHDIFRFLVHDDDEFIYRFLAVEKLVDRYNSVPDAFEESPMKKGRS